MDGEHVVAQPHARVREPHPGGRSPLGQRGSERAGVARLDQLLEPEEAGRLGQEPGVDPTGHEPVVVVAGQHEQLAVRAERPPEVAEQRAGQLRRGSLRAVAELEAVTEDDKPVRVPHSLEQRLAQLHPPKEIPAGGRPEVQVRDHQRPHPH